MEALRSLRLRFDERALSDLANAFDYVAQRSPQAARRILTEIQQASELLREFPDVGHRRADGALEWSVRRVGYVLVYKVDGTFDELTIVAVFHRAQDRSRPL